MLWRGRDAAVSYHAASALKPLERYSHLITAQILTSAAFAMVAQAIVAWMRLTTRWR